MGQITSGVGLISGINTADVIDQLLAIEARPKRLVEQRNLQLTTQQVAFQDISAKLLAMKLSASSFLADGIFGTTAAVSSDESVLSATSNNSTVPGTYSFMVDRLVSTQQVITSGFADQDVSAVAPAGGTLTFEFGDARLQTDSDLGQLNGGLGVSRGLVRITDAAGGSGVVDLSRALTVTDVLEAINNTSGIAVTAAVEGDAFTIVDNSGGGGALSVADVGATGTVVSLGLDAAPLGNKLTGTQVNMVGRDTGLNLLNDGNGVNIRAGVDDFQVALRDGTMFTVNLEAVADLGGVIDTINAASGGKVTASINANGTGLQLIDTSTDSGFTFQVTSLSGSSAAADLGILGSDIDTDGTIVGERVVAGLNSRLLKNLRGGVGITTPGSIDITNRLGNTLVGLDLSSARSTSDVIAIINNAGHGVTASINPVGTGIQLVDTTGGTASDLIVADNVGTTATDLGLAGSVAQDTIDSGNLQLRYISEATRLDALNGGVGVTRGRFKITDSNGAAATVDLTQGDEVTVQNVLSEINSRGLAIIARINDKGDGILIEDTGGGATALRVEEAGSTTARDLGILGQASNPGDDLDGSFEKSISIASVVALTGATTLGTLNGGQGVDVESGQPDFQIITRNGTTHDINLDGQADIANVISTIIAVTGGDITAAINATATGLTLTDNTAGSGTFEVTALNNSGSAADLGILGSDDNGDGLINGSTIIEITTLADVVNQINEAGFGVAATVINDGSTGKPYRLSLQSEKPGGAGRFIFDDHQLNLRPTTLVEARDAVVFFGSTDPAKAIAIRSPSNTLTSAIPNATIDLKGTSNSAVQVTITRDDSAIIDSVKRFVDDFNNLMDTFNTLDSYNAETEERGLLLGDPTIATIRSSLFRIVNASNPDVSGQFTTLAQLGITVRGGANLRFDQSKFSQAMSVDFEAVQKLFTFKETQTDPDTGQVTTTAAGTLVKIDELMDRVTDSQTGLVQNRVNSLASQIELGNRRIEQIDQQLESKRARLSAQFLAMERALAQLQSQNSALAGLQSGLSLFGQSNSNRS